MRPRSKIAGKTGFALLFALSGLYAAYSLGADLGPEIIELPPLRFDGRPARAHTQGLEIVGKALYVTARREDVRPKRALLLRTEKTANRWDVWELLPVTAVQADLSLDHPGGMQSDGQRLWIPIAESRPKSRTLIRSLNLACITNGEPLKSEFEFRVEDHIGAVAVSVQYGILLGANWDTERVYVWDLGGHLKSKLSGASLAARGLGLNSGTEREPRLAVQDWKFIGDRLFASGLVKTPDPVWKSTSRLILFTDFLRADFRRNVCILPVIERSELGREAMALSQGVIHFLPDDLTVSNRLFQVRLTDLHLGKLERQSQRAF